MLFLFRLAMRAAYSHIRILPWDGCLLSWLVSGEAAREGCAWNWVKCTGKAGWLLFAGHHCLGDRCWYWLVGEEVHYNQLAEATDRRCEAAGGVASTA